MYFNKLFFIILINLSKYKMNLKNILLILLLLVFSNGKVEFIKFAFKATGEVTGVGFKKFVRDLAFEWKIKGFVYNF